MEVDVKTLAPLTPKDQRLLERSKKLMLSVSMSKLIGNMSGCRYSK